MYQSVYEGGSPDSTANIAAFFGKVKGMQITAKNVAQKLHLNCIRTHVVAAM